jgi:hypothetical protein
MYYKFGETRMKEKILIRSIIAVAVLINVSFTSVVGYRSMASDVKASPLFNIRRSRAIDEDSKDLSCEYVGKGDLINLLIPDRDKKKALMQRLIDKIRKMNDEAFNKVVNLITLRINKIIYSRMEITKE